MKIAIIGGGFAALASAHYLSPFATVTIFDDERGSASGVAAGLLHKFVGMHSRKNLFADEALELALRLIGPKIKTGLLRKAQSEKQSIWFKEAAEKYPKEIQQIDENTIWIQEAYVVDCPLYLSKLDKVNRTIDSLEDLKDFDKIIVAAGVHSKKFCNLPLHTIRGQLLEVSGSPLPPYPVSSQIYAIPHHGKLIVGSTYEREEKLNAEEELLPKLKILLPEFKVDKVIKVKEGLRASLPGRMPQIKQVNDKTWVFTGLGSKGLLYHAYFAKQLAEALKC